MIPSGPVLDTSSLFSVDVDCELKNYNRKNCTLITPLWNKKEQSFIGLKEGFFPLYFH